MTASWKRLGWEAEWGLHTLRHTFATNLVNGVKQPDGTIRSLSPRQVADLLGHSTSEITELYYVKGYLPPGRNHGRIRSLRHVKKNSPGQQITGQGRKTLMLK
ncbi:MAG: tyrosine-type recombinase/integrase [Dysosmobacter sp.]